MACVAVVTPHYSGGGRGISLEFKLHYYDPTVERHNTLIFWVNSRAYALRKARRLATDNGWENVSLYVKNGRRGDFVTVHHFVL